MSTVGLTDSLSVMRHLGRMCLVVGIREAWPRQCVRRLLRSVSGWAFRFFQNFLFTKLYF